MWKFLRVYFSFVTLIVAVLAGIYIDNNINNIFIAWIVKIFMYCNIWAVWGTWSMGKKF